MYLRKYLTNLRMLVSMYTCLPMCVSAEQCASIYARLFKYLQLSMYSTLTCLYFSVISNTPSTHAGGGLDNVRVSAGEGKVASGLVHCLIKSFDI